MAPIHPKTLRRRILTILYERYLEDPLEMLGPEEFLADEYISRKDLPANMHYLHDRQLVEMMIGYNPPMFAAARITAKGIDLVENRFQFNLQFPPLPDQLEETTGPLPALVERLVEEADFAPLDGEARKCLLRDVQYLRDEVARPAHRWRCHVIHAILDWLEEPFDTVDEVLPSLPKIRALVPDEEE